ncbi:ABC transporter substrate-binding protein [Paenibacillus sp. YN15]|uniref:ABC transporter substrate-binding protein n=1 Tax=Paenibacillus sp. YN15 TaxID=1742774 RepID=UPI0015EC8D14|nr:ABC transporter substrate-binding protein [Paenibacillus sp. YN15]
MKKLLALCLTFAFAAGLMAGCGGKEAAENGDNAAAGASPAASVAASASPAASAAPKTEAAAFPLTYKDALGNEIVIKERPKRVAVAFFHFLEPWFSLDVTPVAADNASSLFGFLSFQPFLKEQANVLDLGSPVSVEKVLESKPDLIIAATPYNDKIMDQLKQIAPVVVFKNDLDWKGRLLEFSKLIGEPKKGQDKVDEIEKLIAANREKLAAKKDETVAFISFNNKGTYTAFGLDRCVAFYDKTAGLGLTPPANYPAVHGKDNIFTLEGLLQLNPSYIFLWDDMTSNSEETTLEELKKNPVWNTLTAVKNNHVFIIDRAAFSAGPLGVEYGVKAISEFMLK